MRHVSTPEVHAFFSNSGSLAMFVGEPRALSRFFIQALIIERASVFASSRVPKTALSTGSLLSGI